ncbi:hypothetical protein XELAEV_18023836mg [Xenopus laevis]|uniref:Uncharacterized protein n=1 Tax=Xenopus laevis TaxID=8355 RepID=A0A974D7R8_XENLA|nr:hypothetical protein XELAEV_18023836mg [Xenopus laevis]
MISYSALVLEHLDPAAVCVKPEMRLCPGARVKSVLEHPAAWREHAETCPCSLQGGEISFIRVITVNFI